MTTEGYRAGQGWHPGSMALAGGLSLAAVLGIAFSAPIVTILHPRPPIQLIPIELPLLPPEIVKPKPQPETKLPRPTPRETVVVPPLPLPVPSSGPTMDITPMPASRPGADTPTGTGTGDAGGGVVLPKLPPVVTIPTMDPRYLNAFQPPYPPQEERAERAGRVVVRILVGVDGRVKRVERIEATSDAFFAATERQALKAWRFTPATRDGTPIEAERTMTVTFRFNE